MYWHADAQERELLLELLRVEGEVARAYEGIEGDDEVVFIDDEEDG